MSRAELKRPAARAELRLARWSEIWPEAKGLFEKHHMEIGHPSFGHEVDEDLAQKLDEAGCLQIVSARVAGFLVGYCIFYISPNLEQKGHFVVQQGPWYVTQEWRAKLGLRLLNVSLEHLRQKKFRQAFLHKWDKSNPRLGLYFESLGGRLLEEVYLVPLGA